MATSTAPTAPIATRRFPLGSLLLLSLGVFVTVTAESLPAGLITLLAFAIAFAVLALASRSTPAVVAAMALWGASTGALFPLLQTALMRTASDSLRAMASAAIIVFFNIGIAGGSWLGGLLVEGAGPIANTAVSGVAVLLGSGGAAIASMFASRVARTRVPAEEEAPI